MSDDEDGGDNTSGSETSSGDDLRIEYVSGDDDDDDDDDDGEKKTRRRKAHVSTSAAAASAKNRTKKRNGRANRESRVEHETKSAAAAAPKIAAEACGLDMRWTFPIDETDETSAKVVATLSYLMQKMQRNLTETELMSYVYTWLVMCHSLNRVNPNEYNSRIMRYTWRHLSSNCFRFEIIARLHELCYATFHHVFDHVHDLMVTHGASPIVLNPPVVHVVPIEHRKLCRMLRAQTEFCQIAVMMVHARWTDFVDAWDAQRRPEDVAAMSQAHTASLGVLCSHMLQILAVLKRKPGDPGFDERMFSRCLWQSAAALSVAQETLPLVLMDLQRMSIRRVSAQIQILLYRMRAKKAEAACAWGAASWFTRKILEVLGDAPHGDGDRNALYSYNTLAELHAATVYPDLKDRSLVADFDEALGKMGLNTGSVTTMSHDVISAFFHEAQHAKGRITPKFPRVRLRKKDGTIHSLESQSIDDILRQ